MTVVPVLVPAQVAEMLGRDAALKEGVAGSVIASGAFIAMVVAPLAGALSDRCSAKQGRRRPFLVAGVFGTSVALVWLASFNGAGSVWLYTLAFLHCISNSGGTGQRVRTPGWCPMSCRNRKPTARARGST